VLSISLMVGSHAIPVSVSVSSESRPAVCVPMKARRTLDLMPCSEEEACTDLATSCAVPVWEAYKTTTSGGAWLPVAFFAAA
jgi:hypothetical protein